MSHESNPNSRNENLLHEAYQLKGLLFCIFDSHPESTVNDKLSDIGLFNGSKATRLLLQTPKGPYLVTAAQIESETDEVVIIEPLDTEDLSRITNSNITNLKYTLYGEKARLTYVSKPDLTTGFPYFFTRSISANESKYLIDLFLDLDTVVADQEDLRYELAIKERAAKLEIEYEYTNLL